MTDAGGSPDLQAILANLARFAHPPQSGNVVEESYRPPNHTNIDSAAVRFNASASTPENSRDKVEDPRLRPQNRSTASPKPVIDPATITTWQEGLRCVSKIAAQNGHFAASIRRMMEDQRKNEMRWYSERQALKQAQANRSHSAAQAQSILQSLSNGLNTPSAAHTSVVDAEVELANLDRKIYAAQLEMETSMVAELKGLGVPFFGTDRVLVVGDRDETLRETAAGDLPKWSPIVTEAELLALRRRMVEHLEDLYRD